MQIDTTITAENLAPAARQLFEAAKPKIRAIAAQTTAATGAPVFTVAGKYTSRGWTEWTQGFQVGAALLVFDATDDGEFLEFGRRATVEAMAPHVTHIGVHDHGKIMGIMEACAAANVPLMVHPHDQALMDHIEKAFWARGERDALAYARAYSANDGVIWDTAIQTLLRLQRATGCHLHLLHIQTSGSVELIREAKRRGQKVTCEVNPWALFLGCDWSAIERLGSYALSYYVPEKNLPILWQGLNDGTLDIIASDHAPHTREEKEIGWKDGWKAHTGTPSAQHYLSMLVDAAHQVLVGE